MRDFVQVVEIAACEAARALLLGPYDGSLEHPGILIDWLVSLMQSNDAMHHELGRRCLADLVESNANRIEIISTYVDKSYSADRQVAQIFFHGLVNAIITVPEIAYSLRSVFFVCIFKLWDTNADVRRDAVRLLRQISSEHFGSTGGFTYHLPLDIDIEPAYAAINLRFLSRISSDRPELTYPLLGEMMFRSPQIDLVGQRRMLTCFHTWFRNIDFSTLPISGSHGVITAACVLTIKHVTEREGDVEKMWRLMVREEKNVSLILDFLFQFGVNSQNRDCVYYFKQICLFISRESSSITVRHLVTQLCSVDVKALGLERVTRGNCPSNNSWELHELLPPQPYQEPFSRSHYAIAMLSNIAVEFVEDCEVYLARILHAIFLAADRRNDIITSHSLYLLHNIAISLLATQTDSQDSLSSLSNRIDSLRGQSLWAYEDVSREKLKLKSTEILTDSVTYFVMLFGWKTNLVEEWGSESLSFGLTVDHTHLMCRSLQIYRALQPQITQDCLIQLLCRLKQYMVKPESIDVGIEIFSTLQVCVLFFVRFDFNF
jgi:hypothetical protein